jgi:signal transduction histidine kinase
MNQDRFGPLGDRLDFAGLEEANRLLAAFSHTSILGFAICDHQLRYHSINSALAASNGLPVEAHLGSTVRDILGEVADFIEPAMRHVAVTGQVISKEVTGRLPTRQGVGNWIVNYFPIKATAHRVRHLGSIVVEVTELRSLDYKLTHHLLPTWDKESSRVAQELHDSVSQYFAVLTNSLGLVNQHIWQLDKTADEQVASTLELLDQRIDAMRTLVSAVSGCFAIDRQRLS